MRHEKTDPVVLARKRKGASKDESGRSPKVPALQRGILSWDPPAIDGEDEQSCKAHVAWMQKEWKRKQHNIALVKKRMELTYSFRRQMLNSGEHLLKDVKGMYPFIFARDQLKEEYNRLMADENAAESIISNLLELAPKIIKIAEKRNLSSPEVQKLLGLCKCEPSAESDNEAEELNAEEKAFVAFCLLPYLLDRKTKSVLNPEASLYQVGDDAKAVANMMKSNVPPFLIFHDMEPEIADIYIAGEKQVLMKITGGIIEAVGSLMFLYYVCNIKYPKECFNTLTFLQRQVLQIYDTQKVPTKVLMLLSELNNI